MMPTPRPLTSRRGLTSVIALTAAMLVLTGCIADFDGYADLKGERTSADEIPQFIADDLSEYLEVDLSSSKYLGEHDGAAVWIMQGERANTVCLLAHANAEDSFMGCGMKGSEFTIGTNSRLYSVVPNGWVADSENFTKLWSNVYAKTGPML